MDRTDGTDDDMSVGKISDGMYRGVLPRKSLGKEGGGWEEVAIKRMGKELVYFQKEVSALSKTNHENVVKLLGCCTEKGEGIIIYEYMGGGSLRHALFKETDETKFLSFSRRALIGLQVSRGLSHLHENNIIHRDLRPGTILLDENCNAKITGLKYAKLPEPPSKVEKMLENQFVIGQVGYICPSYLETGNVTKKTDVFAFGVILLELLSGRHRLPRISSGEEVSLVEIIEQPELNILPLSFGTDNSISSSSSSSYWGPEMALKFEENLALKKRIEDLHSGFADERKKMMKEIEEREGNYYNNNENNMNANKDLKKGGDRESLDEGWKTVENDKRQKSFVSTRTFSYSRLKVPTEEGIDFIENETSKENNSKEGSRENNKSSEKWKESNKSSGESMDSNIVAAQECVASFGAFMDPKLARKYDEEIAKKIAILGARCVQSTPSIRPKMEEVVEELQKIVDENFSDS